MSESILAALSSLSIQAGEPRTASHAAASSQGEWTDVLAALPESTKPANYRLLKTLVFKPKTAKSETPVPVMVVTDEATQCNTSAIGSHLKLKELRLAVPEPVSYTHLRAHET